MRYFLGNRQTRSLYVRIVQNFEPWEELTEIVRWLPVLGKLAEASVRLHAIYYAHTYYFTELQHIERAFVMINNKNSDQVSSHFLNQENFSNSCLWSSECCTIPMYNTTYLTDNHILNAFWRLLAHTLRG